jgi:hypothetical protein
MELEDLVLERYRVERVEGKMVAIKDPLGLYMANSAAQIEHALSDRRRILKIDHIYFRASPKSGHWRLMSRKR